MENLNRFNKTYDGFLTKIINQTFINEIRMPLVLTSYEEDAYNNHSYELTVNESHYKELRVYLFSLAGFITQLYMKRDNLPLVGENVHAYNYQMRRLTGYFINIEIQYPVNSIPHSIYVRLSIPDARLNVNPDRKRYVARTILTSVFQQLMTFYNEKILENYSEDERDKMIEDIMQNKFIIKERAETQGFCGELKMNGTIKVKSESRCGDLCVAFFYMTKQEKAKFYRTDDKVAKFKDKIKNFNYVNFDDFNNVVAKGVLIFDKNKDLIYKYVNPKENIVNPINPNIKNNKNIPENYLKLLHDNNHYTVITRLNYFKKNFCIMCMSSHKPNFHNKFIQQNRSKPPVVDYNKVSKLLGIKITTYAELMNANISLVVMNKSKIVGTSKLFGSKYTVLQLSPLSIIKMDKPYCKYCGEFTSHKKCRNVKKSNNNFINGKKFRLFSLYYDRELVKNMKREAVLNTTSSNIRNFRPINIKLRKYRYFAYDIESTITNNKHDFSLLVCQELYTDNQHVFYNLDDFFKFVSEIEESNSFYAHNASGYDSYILMNYLIDKGVKPKDVICMGQKIVKFKYGKTSFRDSMKHLPMSLNAAAKTYNLKEQKTLFPYEFYTKENKFYKGKIPDRKYFNCTNEEYELESKKYKTYDIHKICIDYCKLDVKLLTKTLENYRDNAIKINKLDPLNDLTIASYALTVYRTNHIDDNKIANLQGEEATFARKAFFGGRTETFKTYCDEEMTYLDINSLYPYVQKTKELPIGKPRYFKDGHPFIKTLNEINKKYKLNKISFFWKYINGFFKKYNEHYDLFLIEILLSKNDLNIPLIGYKIDGKFIFDSKEKRIVLTNFELSKALELGYDISNIYEIHVYKSSKDLFKDYISKYEVIKNNSKKENNTGMYHISKLMLNSLWGKFGQKRIRRKCVYYESKEEWVKLLLRERRSKDIRIMNFKQVKDLGMGINGEIKKGLLKVQYDEMCLHTNTNSAIAAFITSHARLCLYSGFEHVGIKNMVYCDTDSMIYKSKDVDCKLIGDEFGDWKDETDGDRLIEFASIGPKSYAFKTKSGMSECKAKGFICKLTFDDMVNLVKNKESIDVPHLTFRRKNGNITTNKGIKVITMKYNKRKLNGYNSLPN